MSKRERKSDRDDDDDSDKRMTDGKLYTGTLNSDLCNLHNNVHDFNQMIDVIIIVKVTTRTKTKSKNDFQN